MSANKHDDFTVVSDKGKASVNCKIIIKKKKKKLIEIFWSTQPLRTATSQIHKETWLWLAWIPWAVFITLVAHNIPLMLCTVLLTQGRVAVTNMVANVWSKWTINLLGGFDTTRGKRTQLWKGSVCRLAFVPFQCVQHTTKHQYNCSRRLQTCVIEKLTI